MTDKKLGRGLDLLIRKTTTSTPETPKTGNERLAVTAIVPNPYQPRKEFPVDSLNDLISSIRTHGVLQPIAVRPATNGYQLISGERRWRACQELGLETIPAVVIAASDEEMLEFALVENLQREDLNPIDKAIAYRELMTKFSMTQEVLAQRLSQNRSTVANTLRLLDLPEDVQSLVRDGKIQAGHARAILAIGNDEVRQHAVARAAAGEATVRDLEALAHAHPADLPQPEPGTPPREPSRDRILLDDLARQLSQALGTKVEIRGTGRRGKITLHYHGRPDLDRYVQAIRAMSPAQEDSLDATA